MNAEDAAYLDRWVNHRDADAFREIVVRYAAMVYATSRRVLGTFPDAEDVAQESFQALANLDRPPAAYLGPWLHRVATNIALNKRRALARAQSREIRYAQSRQLHVDPDWEDIYEFVDEALANLPDGLRIPLIAHYLEGKSQSEVAASLGIPRQTLTNRIHKGIKEIRRTLARRGIQVGGIALGGMMASNMADAAALPPRLMGNLGKTALAGITHSGAASLKSMGAFKAVAAVAGIAAVVLFASYVAHQPDKSLRDVDPFAPLKTVAVVPSPETTDLPSQSSGTATAMTVRDVLRNYADHQDRIQRIIYTYEYASEWYRQNEPGSPWEAIAPSGPGKTWQRGEVGYDGRRFNVHTHTWGDYGGKYRTANDAAQRICRYDGKEDIQWDAGGNRPLGTGSIGKGAPIGETIQQPRSYGNYYGLWAMYFGGEPFGYFTDEGRRIDKILRSAKSSAVKTERHGATDYQIIEADTEFGYFTVWFDPDKHFNIVRMHRHLRRGDVTNLSDTNVITAEGFARNDLYTVTELAQVSGLWIVKSHTRETSEEAPENGFFSRSASSCTRTSIALNPDFEALETFTLMRDIPAGSEWLYRTFPGDSIEQGDYRIWDGAKLVPMAPRTRRP
ncbi:MAG: hypothetical protein AMXMBFR84_26830 [Candidatus Hydrogenedentota bacterium]